jgi:hypothetical protein
VPNEGGPAQAQPQCIATHRGPDPLEALCGAIFRRNLCQMAPEFAKFCAKRPLKTLVSVPEGGPGPSGTQSIAFARGPGPSRTLSTAFARGPGPSGASSCRSISRERALRRPTGWPRSSVTGQPSRANFRSSALAPGTLARRSHPPCTGIQASRCRAQWAVRVTGDPVGRVGDGLDAPQRLPTASADGPLHVSPMRPDGQCISRI